MVTAIVGFNVTLSVDAAHSIHSYQDFLPIYNGDVLLGTWQPDGSGLGVFEGMNPENAWTLFVADENSGGVMTVNSWGLQIETIPEPSTFALAGFGCLLLFLSLQRKQQNQPGGNFDNPLRVPAERRQPPVPRQSCGSPPESR